jgi:pilus assembly protein CpaF
MLNQSLSKEIENEIYNMPLQDISFGALENHHSREEKIRSLITKKIHSLSSSEQKRIFEEFLGNGPISSYLEDDQINEIIILSYDLVWIEKNGKLEKADDHFLSPLTYQQFVERLCQNSGLKLDLEYPCANGSYNGFRIQIVGENLTQGSNLICLRKHPKSPWTLDKLFQNHWCQDFQLEIIKKIIYLKKNFLVVGGTSTGKTSFLNACLNLLSENERVVLIEDTSELNIPNQVSNKLITRFDAQNILPNIDQSELIRQSLRLRPDRLVVGEVRGGEAKDLLMALSTGHEGSFGSLHANSAAQALIRLEMLVQLGAPNWGLHAIRNLISLSLDYVFVLEKKPGCGRRLQAIYRLVSLEQTGFLLEKIESITQISEYTIEVH